MCYLVQRQVDVVFKPPAVKFVLKFIEGALAVARLVGFIYTIVQYTILQRSVSKI